MTKKDQLVVLVQFTEKPLLLSELMKTILDCSCSIIKAHYQQIVGNNVSYLLLDGKWDAIAKAELAITKWAKKNNIALVQNRIKHKQYNNNLIPYDVRCDAYERPEILYEICRFFAQHNVTIHHFDANRYLHPLTNTPLFNLNLQLLIPTTLNIFYLRDEFIEYCEQLNIDAVLEPN